MTWDTLVASGVVAENVALARLTTYRFGGPARFYADVGSRLVLDQVVEALVAAPLPILVIGRGSNLVVSDRGFDGLAVKLSGEFLDVAFGEETADAGGAVALPRLARTTVREGRRGLEFFVGIPGSVGGAIAMNAGCFGSDTSDWLIDAELVNLRTGVVRIADPGGLNHRYRHSNVTSDELVTSAAFRTEPGLVAEGETKIRDITKWRKRTQPGGTYNAGSVFQNPHDDAAGRLIDQAGLKGMTVGGARVSERHANFFVATDQATAQDVFDLVATVRSLVEERTGVVLTPEIRFAGEFVGRQGGGTTDGDPRSFGAGAPS